MQRFAGPLEADGIPPAEFMLLTRIPSVIYDGDFIPKEPSANPGQDGWRARLEMARKRQDAVNKRGGELDQTVSASESGLEAGACQG